MLDLRELDEYLNDLPTHEFPTDKPADEPYALDIVSGWWGVGTVSDVAETQGTCRVITERGKTLWIENSEIKRNLTEEKTGR